MDKRHFQLVRKSPVSSRIANQIKEMIVNGHLQPDDKLPSERELSKTLGVGRFSLREALRTLESMGILETKYGVSAGTYVTKISTSDLSEKLSEMFMFSNITIEQFTEARLEVGLITLRHFLQNAGTREIDQLEECLEEAETLLNSGRPTREKVFHFHELIAAGSKNPVFVVLHKSLFHILRGIISNFDSPPDYQRRVLENHRRTLGYMKSKNVEKACSSMRDHILYIGSRTKSLLEGVQTNKKSRTRKLSIKRRSVTDGSLSST